MTRVHWLGMLARCTNCESTFVTSEFGRQRCPKCRAEIVVDDPRPGAGNPYTPPAAPAEALAPPPVSELTPWERRSELGLFRALWATIAAVLGHPILFFTRLGYGNDDGATLYYVFIAVIPAVISQILTWVTSDPAADKAAMTALIDGASGAGVAIPPTAKAFLDAFEKFEAQAGTVQGLILTLVETPVYWLLLLFISAGVSHLLLALLGRAKGGWVASFKVFAYAFTPVLLMALPSCTVELVALTWATCLQILGLSKAHRISFTLASVGVIGFHLVAATAACALVGVALLVVLGAHGAS